MKAVNCLFLILLLSGCGRVVVEPQRTSEVVIAEACDDLAHSVCRKHWGFGQHSEFSKCKVAKLRDCLNE